MPYQMSKPQFEEVLSLPAGQRYRHFIAKVADWQEIWTLRGPDGFVMFGDTDQRECLPVWPHPDYAAALATDPWAACTPERLDLEAFLTRWIPGLARDNRRVAVFPTPQAKGVVVEPQQLQADLSVELEQYE
ncbi:MAG TPA: DUF2750 domain-containing protein [Candidatus Anammoximicrobium sp.]|nr:DUF2750 domain-containing protein [Candidatus Anammoximicrobium sp.]